MNQLKEINYGNQLEQIGRGLKFLEAEYKAMLDMEVMINEHDENQLNAIFADVERRMEAARRGLSAANKITDPAERRQHVGRMLGHLNRTRALLDNVVKTWFSEKPLTGEDGKPQLPSRDEYITPQQASETLGIPTAKLQNYVVSNKLKMYNHGGRWALKGSEVQALANQLSRGGNADADRMNSLRAKYTNRASFDVQ